MQDSRPDNVQIPLSLLRAILVDLDSGIEFVHAHDDDAHDHDGDHKQDHVQDHDHEPPIALPSSWFQGLMLRDPSSRSSSSTATVELYSQDVQKLLESCRDVIRGLVAQCRRAKGVGSIDLMMDHSTAGKAEEDEDEASKKGAGVSVDVEEVQDMYDFDADHGY